MTQTYLPLIPAWFPPQLQQFILGVTPPKIFYPPAFEQLVCRNATSQWYTQSKVDPKTGKRESHYEFEQRLLRSGYPTTYLVSDPRGNNILLHGWFLFAPYDVENVFWIKSTSFVSWIPPDYPNSYPRTFFCNEQRIIVPKNFLPPYRVESLPFTYLYHRYVGGEACICHLDVEAKPYGGEGWKPSTHNLRIYVSWLGRYLNNHHVAQTLGSWPDDDKSHRHSHHGV